MATRHFTAPTGLRRLLDEPWVARAFGLALGLVVWTGLASVFPNQLMPYPFETLELAYGLIEAGTAWPNLSITLQRTLWGFLGAMVIGLVLGVLMGVNNYGQKFFTPYVIIGLSIPGVAWALVGTLVFGFSILSPVSATIITVYPYIAIDVWKGVENIEADLVNMSKAFRVSRRRMLRRLILPNAAPFLFSAFRFGLAISWKVVTVVEIFASSSGVGYQAIQAYEVYRFETAWAWMVLFIIVILVIEYVFVKPLERKIFAYRHDADFTILG